jgi:hypothetical protein
MKTMKLPPMMVATSFSAVVISGPVTLGSVVA